jgi:putative two-component system response regulator
MNFFLQSAQLHDVGKIAISDRILNKPDKLTQEEFDIMKNHVLAGVEAIEKILSKTKKHTFLDHALVIAGTHHEKWDGSGYPIGLKGNNIPLKGRLMAIADVYDALISERPYKKAFTHTEACNIIEKGAGTHFDPILVDVFHSSQNDFARISTEQLSQGTYRENERLSVEALHHNGEPVSGTCGNGGPLTSAEIINWKNEHAAVSSVPHKH